MTSMVVRARVLFLYGSTKLLFDSAYRTLNLTCSLTIIVKSHHGKDPLRLFPNFKMALLRQAHQLVPRTFDQGPKCGHSVVEATGLYDLDEARNVAANRLLMSDWNNSKFQYHWLTPCFVVP